MKFDPNTIDYFIFKSYEYDESSGIARLHYALDDQYDFCEEYQFMDALPLESDAQRAALDLALRYLHLAAGVSYYKTAIPKQVKIETGALSNRAADFFSKLYKKGLAEFCFVNDLALDSIARFPADEDLEVSASTWKAKESAVVPIGGGKDSLVSVHLLRNAGETVRGFYLGDNALINNLSREINLELVKVKRVLSRNILELNEQGAYNGHVPISSIIAFSTLVAGIIYGFDTVIMSNERSANVGSFVAHGSEVNHQYSKSLEFENDFRALVKAEIVSNFDYFSLLRPLSELMIGRSFAGMPEFHQLFVSCNRAFTLQNKKTGWCLNCPKCRFVFLSLAPFLEKSVLMEIFGKNLLDDESQLAGYKELVGHEMPKPFECVGETQESAVALALLIEKEEWQDDLVIQYFRNELPKLLANAKNNIDSVMSPVASDNIPSRYRDVIHAAC